MVRMETDCNLTKIGPLFFKFSLLSSKNHYSLIKFYSPFKNSLHFFLQFSVNHFVHKKNALSFELSRIRHQDDKNTCDIAPLVVLSR